MKNLWLLLLVIFSSCATSHTAHHKHVTPKAYSMTKKEKDNQNYDLKESKKVIASNIKHKKSNQKAAERKRQIDNQNAMLLNANSKAKKEKKTSAAQAFNFYH